MLDIEGKYTKAHITTDDIDEACVEQIAGLCSHPAFTNPIAIMPDAHAGKGAVIGFTMKLGTGIVPEVIGVDIACGVLGAKLSKPWDKPDVYDDIIRENIPVGLEVRDERTDISVFEPYLSRINSGLSSFAAKLGLEHEPVTLDTIAALLDEMGKRSWYGIGSLGGGNHFIEVDRAPSGDEWLMIHSGSRNFGLKVCEKWTKIAEKGPYSRSEIRAIFGHIREQALAGLFPTSEIRQRFDAAVASELHIENGVAWLEGKEALGYLREMLIAQAYACLNRRTMMRVILAATNYEATEMLETMHNYICTGEPMTIRKGAVSALKGEKIIVPLNMAAGTLICVGKGNEEWNFSAPHGAGRRMSRKKAFRELSAGEFLKQMADAGVFMNNDPYEVLDEAPDAYKPEEEILKLLPDTAEIIEHMKPIHNIKANEKTFYGKYRKKK
jgi:tRNA-splicing ligase RtcB